MSLVDKIAKRLIVTNFFGDGWGDQQTFLKLLHFKAQFKDATLCLKQMSAIKTPRELNFRIKEETTKSKHFQTFKGQFDTPLSHSFPGLIPAESKVCTFTMVLPKVWNPEDPHKRVCLHYAATGDHTFWRRSHFLAQPLAKDYKIGSVILENPFYGSRKPKKQFRSGIRQVSDLFIMGCALMLEGQFLFSWLADNGFDRLGISGISLGGHNASMASAIWRRPIATIPCLSWSTAAHSFSEGIISTSCMWNVLEAQLSPSKLDEIHSVIRKTDCEIQDILEARYGSEALVVVSPEYRKTMFSLLRSKYIANLANSLGSRKLPSKITTIYMRLLIDEFSNLKHYPVPACPESTIVVVAEDDLYVTRPADIQDIQDIWPGCEVRVVKGGHISSYLTHNHTFRLAINDAFLRLDGFLEKEPSGS